MANNFDIALKWNLIDEGGNDNDPYDRGGRTSRGITQREYDAWKRLRGKGTSDVWKATDQEVATIYKEQYWLPYCPNLPAGLDYLFFDISVNCGRTQAVKQFQKALGVQVDGMMGKVTEDAIGSADPHDLIKRISDVRRAYYRHLKQFPRYGRGWLNRVNHAEKGALSLVGTQPTMAPAPEPAHKATEPDAPTVSPEASGSATVAAGGLLEALNNFKDNLINYAYALSWIQYVLIGIALVGLGYSIYGFWYRNKVQKATQ